MTAKDELIEELATACRDVIVMHHLESSVTDKMREATSKRIYDAGGLVYYMKDLLAAIDNLPDVMYNDPTMKAAFREEFTPAYLERVQETTKGREIAELLYMAFCRGYLYETETR